MDDESTTMKIQIFGLNGTKTSWFLHQTSCNNSLEIILSEIFSGKSPYVSKAKIAELTGLGTEFNSNANTCTLDIGSVVMKGLEIECKV